MDDDNAITETPRRTTKPLSNGFIPKLRVKKVTIRLLSVGQPVTGILDAFSPYELILQMAKGRLLVFEHAIATIEIMDEPKGFKSFVAEEIR